MWQAPLLEAAAEEKKETSLKEVLELLLEVLEMLLGVLDLSWRPWTCPRMIRMVSDVPSCNHPRGIPCLSCRSLLRSFSRDAKLRLKFLIEAFYRDSKLLFKVVKNELLSRVL